MEITQTALLTWHIMKKTGIKKPWEKEILLLANREARQRMAAFASLLYHRLILRVNTTIAACKLATAKAGHERAHQKALRICEYNEALNRLGKKPPGVDP